MKERSGERERREKDREKKRSTLIKI